MIRQQKYFIRTVRLLLCAFCLLVSYPSHASYNLYKGTNPELSNNAILSMHQDKDGYMWFGTYDGLNLYNSKNVIVFRFDMHSEHSLCSNIIHRIYDAEDGYLWIMTFMGLNKFDLKRREVVGSWPEYVPRFLATNAAGSTCLLNKNDSIDFYSPETGRFTSVPLPGMALDDVLAFYSSGDNFSLINRNGEKIDLQIQSMAGKTLTLQTERKTIHTQPLKTASYQPGFLFLIDKSGQLYQYTPENEQKIYISDIKSLIERYGQITQIVSFRKNIFIAFKSRGVFRLVADNQYEAEPLNLNIGIFSLLKDNRQDILWIGTDGMGTYMYYNKHEQFRSITLDQLPAPLFNPVRSLFTDEEQTLWVGTKGGGIVRIKDYGQYANGAKIPPSQITSYTKNSGLSNNEAYCFQESKWNRLVWIGTEGPGLSYYSRDKARVMTPEGPENLRIQKVHSIYEQDQNTLWVATAGAGLLKITYAMQQDLVQIQSVTTFIFRKNGKVCNEFHSMHFDNDSTLFIGSRGGYGVIRFNIYTHLYDFISMSDAENSAIGDVLSVYQSRDSVFYFGASSGLTSMLLEDNKGSRIRQYDRRDGISNDMIHGILEDGNSCLWLSTNKGLTKFNPHNQFFHNYLSDLKVTEFSDDAYWECPYTHRLFFGGINGLAWIDPKEYVPEPYTPPISFFDLRLDGNPVSFNDYIHTSSQRLTIPANVNSFTLSFIAVDNINGDNYEYSFLMEGHNADWVRLQKTNEVTFTNLTFGNYTLKVRYKNDVFDSDSRFYELKIHVSPPWYLSTVMIGIYILALILLGVALYFIIKRKLREKQQALANKINEQQREKLLDIKLNFFTNITHELCTPLTLINGVSERISRFPGGDRETFNKYTAVLNNNVNSLNELIQEILDFRKIEDSEFNLDKIREVDLKQLMKKLLDSFQPIAEQNELDYTFEYTGEANWNTDAALFKKVLNNLLSNAFKYTPQGGTIRVSAVRSGESLTVKVYNTGRGIGNDKLPHIFNRFHILENMEENAFSQMSSRHGLGLSIAKSIVDLLKGRIEVESEVGKYAEFTVTLPSLEAQEENAGKQAAVTETGKRVAEWPGNMEDTRERPVILVVDDNQDIVWLISEALAPFYQVLKAFNVADGLKIIRKQSPALIITDIIMPTTDGLEFTSQVKADKFTRHVPVLIISAKITAAEQAEGFDAGADAYLPKPFTEELLLSVVKRLLSTKDEMKAYYQSYESAFEYAAGQLVHVEDKEFLDQVISILKANIEDVALRPELIAEQLGMNVRTLYRRFKKISELSPTDFIKDFRLNYAANLLLTTNLTVQEIIYKTGISNKSYFYREFSRKYHVTPNDYRKQSG